MNETQRRDLGMTEIDVEPNGQAAVKSRGPEIPPEINASEAEAMRRDAEQVVRTLTHSEGSEAIGAMDEISSLGIKEQSAAVRELDLLKTRLRAIMTDEGPGGLIARDLAELRIFLDDIKLNKTETGSAFGRVFRAIPIIGRVSSPANKIKKISMRYEPVSRQVAMVETRLREGRAALLHDNVELRKLYEGVEQQRPEIARSAFLGELIVEDLERAVEEEKDVDKARRLQAALADVAVRVQDLRTMGEVCMQYLVSIEMSRQNNVSLSHAVDRTLALGSNVVMVGLALQIALSRQSRVMEANQRTRDFLGNLVVSNAELIKRHTEEIGDVYKSPVIAIEKVTQAHASLVEAIESARRLRTESVIAAKQNIERLNDLASKANGETLALTDGEVVLDINEPVGAVRKGESE